jgi:Fe-Mn family superoxide dismutase
MALELPALPYSYDALADLGMSEETLRLHHALHHQAYVDNGNKALAGTEWEARTVEDIVVGTYKNGAVAQSAIFNNVSQHWNHTLFWEIIGPKGKTMPPELAAALADGFDSPDSFRDEFVASGVSQFGSGWVWLIRDKDSGSLRILKTENGVNPLCFGHRTLLGCDVWEHSYYVDFRNKRPAYLENFLDKLVNWEAVAARL